MIPLPVLIPLCIAGYLAIGLFTVYFITTFSGKEFFSGDEQGLEYLPFLMWPIAWLVLLGFSFHPFMRWVITQGDAVKRKKIENKS